MNWTCPNCGKTMEVSQEQLAETQGVIVCPQCLSSDTVPGYHRPKSKSMPAMSTTAQATTPPTHHDDDVPPRATTKSSHSTVQPPPYRKKISFVEETPTRSSVQPSRTAPSQPKKKSKKKKKKSRGLLAPHTPWGCLWRTALYSAILLAIVTFLGYLLDSI
ncbi:MAG: hypothetical protein IJ775_00160 [Muribaculaceae bacterium]|nr:hypothetical protein [Muribaculaceae bacterium]